MLNVDDNRLSEEQKQLVIAFNAAADYFKERLLGNVKTSPEVPNLKTLTHSRTGEQANSAIAHEAIELVMGEKGSKTLAFSDAIKNGGTFEENRYYVEEILGTNDKSKKQKYAEECRIKILVNLLIASHGDEFLPREYIKDESKRLGFVPNDFNQ